MLAPPNADDDGSAVVGLLRMLLQHDPEKGMELLIMAMEHFPDRADPPNFHPELLDDVYVRFVSVALRKGLSKRQIAKHLGTSEATIRRQIASFDAAALQKPNEINGDNSAAATNVASPALAAVLRNLPKLTPPSAMSYVRNSTFSL
jgi:hypothetical protein